MSKRACFLDRDGVINQERKDYVKNLDEFKVLNGVTEAIRLLKENNLVVIVVTNQSAINRGLLSVRTLHNIHNYLQNYLRKYKTFVDGFYFCPHLPSEECNCRKPKAGMLIQAAKEHDIDLKKSFFIGNEIADIQAASNAGCKGILIKEGQTLLQTVLSIYRE